MPLSAGLATAPANSVRPNGPARRAVGLQSPAEIALFLQISLKNHLNHAINLPQVRIDSELVSVAEGNNGLRFPGLFLR